MKRKIVLASGVFDLLHLGHVRFLEEAKKAGGENAWLVVIIARDDTVEMLKGSKPVMPEDQRRALVEALKVVDEAVLGFKGLDIISAIKKIKPDIVAVGHDQDYIADKVEQAIRESNLNVKIVRIGRFGQKELTSSSRIKRKIIEAYTKRN